MPIPTEKTRQSVVRIHYCGPEGELFGSGVFVAPTAILTARHVVDPSELSIAGGAPPVSAVTVESNAFFGRREPRSFSFPADPGSDLAIVFLQPDHAVGVEYCCAVRAQPANDFTIGDEADVFGFSSRDGDVEGDQVRILALHPRAGAYVCNRPLPQGFSGGPVTIDGGLIGLAFARNPVQGRAYCYGVGELRLLFDSLTLPVTWVEHDLSPLRQYPIGPAIGANEILMQLGHVIDAYVNLYSGRTAIRVVAEANKLREECGPKTDRRGLIELGSLPNPDIALSEFWFDAFVQAGKKSPRMLAALVNVIDRDSLEEAARVELEAFLKRIVSRPH